MSTCGKKVKCSPVVNESNKLAPDETKRVEKVVGTLLCCSHVLDNAMLVEEVDSAAIQAKLNKETVKELVHLLNHASTHPDEKIYHRK